MQKQKMNGKVLILLFFAVSPFIIGYLFNYGLIKHNWSGTVPLVISILFYAYWFFAGYLSANFVKSAWKSVLISHSFAIICVILIVIQEAVLRRYLPNIIGTSSQMFFLPTISLVSAAANILAVFISIHYRGWAACVFAFLLMAALYYGGYSVSSKKIKL
jgi:hypothetical protein